MLKLRTAALAAALLLSSSAFANSNLLTNGDFETGDLTGWTTSEPALDATQGVSTDFYSVVSPVAHSGFIYYDGTMGHQGTLSQSVGTIAGAVYTLEFDLQRYTQYPPTDNQLTITFAGHTVLDETNGSNNWQHYSFTGLTASGASSLLQFANRNDNDYTELDNVSVIMTAVPEPSIALMMLGGLFLVAYRSRRPPPF
jgi:hypothetical protein